MEIASIVNVQISKETTAVSQAGFGTALILGIHSAFDEGEYIRFYDSMDAVESDFSSSTEEYVAASKLFGQEAKPEKIAIGQRDNNEKQKVLCRIINDLDNTDYTVIINSSQFIINSGEGASSQSIAAALVAAISAGTEPILATDNQDGTYEVEANIAGDPFLISVDENQSSEETNANKNIASELSKIADQNDDWYALVLTKRATEEEQIQDIKQASEWIEARTKILGISNDQASITTSTIDDIASFLKDKSYERTFIIYSKDDSSYPEAAWFGGQLPQKPGSITWMFKTLSGITVDRLTPTEITNAINKNANIYITVGGVNIMQEGTMANKQYIDIVRGVDWLQARIQEGIYSRLVNLKKIPYTNKGVGIVEAEIRKVLREAQDNDFVTTNPDFTISVPLVEDISSNNKINRLLPDIKFTAYLTGAVHKVQVNGVVTI